MKKKHGPDWHHARAMRRFKAANRARIAGDEARAATLGAEGLKHLRIYTALWLGGSPAEIRGYPEQLTVRDGVAGRGPAKVYIVPPL